jgi:hypothetical protein
MRWALRVFFWVFVVIFGITAIGRWSRGQPLPAAWSERPAQYIAFFVGISAVLGLLIFVIGWVWSATVSRRGLKASTLWGGRLEVPWAAITEVRSSSIQGLPVLIVRSTTMSDIYVYTLGVDLHEVHSKLLAAAGPDHLLTKCFAPHDA